MYIQSDMRPIMSVTIPTLSLSGSLVLNLIVPTIRLHSAAARVVAVAVNVAVRSSRVPRVLVLQFGRVGGRRRRQAAMLQKVEEQAKQAAPAADARGGPCVCQAVTCGRLRRRQEIASQRDEVG